MREFDLIAGLADRLRAQRADTRLGIGDDAGVITPTPGRELAVTTDTLIAGRHFPTDTPAFDVGYKAIAVNLSDLAAMGADPAWLTLALSTPALEHRWCDAFIDGAVSALVGVAIDIVGGDTTRGSLAVNVTAIGQLPRGGALLRSGARGGDVIAVTGALGDAAQGLKLWSTRAQSRNSDVAYLVHRLCRPQWRAGAALRGLAHAAIDVSDGLAADLAHLLSASGVGATINVDRLPCSLSLRRLVPDRRERRRLQLAGGDDYELCISLPAQSVDAARAALDCELTVIGRVERATGQRYVDANGAAVALAPSAIPGWDHFG